MTISIQTEYINILENMRKHGEKERKEMTDKILSYTPGTKDCYVIIIVRVIQTRKTVSKMIPLQKHAYANIMEKNHEKEK